MTSLHRQRDCYSSQPGSRQQEQPRQPAITPRSIPHPRSSLTPIDSSPSVSPELLGYSDSTRRRISTPPDLSYTSTMYKKMHANYRTDNGDDALLSQYHRDISSSTRFLSIHDDCSPTYPDQVPRSRHDYARPSEKRMAPDMLTPSGELPPLQIDYPRLDPGVQSLPSIRSTLGDLNTLPPLESSRSIEPRVTNRSSHESAFGHSQHRNHNMAPSPPMSPDQSYRGSLPSRGSVTLQMPPISSTGRSPFDSSMHSNASAHNSESPVSAGITSPSLSQADTVSSTTAGSFVCSYPGCKAQPFQTQYLLNSHANVHSSARPHYCPVQGCPRSEGGKGFKRKNEMIRHGLVHDSPGYICPFCPDREHRYPRPDNLQR